jgi:hypothetical protein
MDYSFFFRHLRSAAIVCMVFAACFAFSDEWKARHPLVSPTGVMNLTELPHVDRTPVTNAEFKKFWMPPATTRRTTTIFCATGKMAATPKAGRKDL